MHYRMLPVYACMVALVLCDDDRSVVEAPAGKFRGHYGVKTRDGQMILSFEGIPYAQPPVGELRFKDPEKMPVLNETYDATKDNILCFQPPLNFSQISNVSSYRGSEDCLYLSIYKPKVVESKTPLPVLVWIHGGGFFLGTGSRSWHGPDYFLDKDMILVSINYRLGVLGFLSTGDDVIPGNFGMKDQIMALKWIQENIASFGGDPNSVTIAGVSAGGTAVSLLMHSPLSKGLFQRAISQSGTAYSSYAAKPWNWAREDARDIATYLGCVFKSETFLKCLQKMPLRELFKASASTIPVELKSSFEFAPTVQEKSPEAFLTLESLNEPSKIPFLSGVTNKESIYLIRMMAGKKYENQVPKMKEDLEKLLPMWGNYESLPDKDKITERLARYYFGDGGYQFATETQITDYISDIMFNYGLYKAARKEQGPTYLYMLSYKGSSKPFSVKLPEELEGGVGHGEDMQFFFPKKMFASQSKGNFSEKDVEMSKKMIDMWYNFACTGNPTPDNNLWEESDKGVKYLDITNDGLIMKSNMFKDRMAFLSQLNIDRYQVDQ